MDRYSEQEKNNRNMPRSNEETILVNASGTISFLSNSACERFGYQEREAAGLKIDELFTEISIKDIEDGMIIPLYGKDKNRRTFPVFIKINTFQLNGEAYFLIVFQDAKDKSKLRREIREPLNELVDLKFALDESTIVAFTDENGIIKYVNEKFCKVSKYSSEEVVGKTHRIINSGYHRKEFFTEMWQTISAGQVWKGEIKNRAKDGTAYWVDTTIVPFLNEEGKPYQYLAIRHEITARKRVEEELQRMMLKMMDVQEEERKRLSRDLHDGLGQNLYSHLITINRMQADLNHPLLEQMQQEALELIAEVREISWELRPSVLDDLGLVPAIRSFLSRFSDYYKIDVSFECVLHERLETGKELAIYRIIQEALTNIRKYAETEEASVTMRETDNFVRVLIEDFGKGFESEKIARGVGLFSMEERARAVGGSLRINSAPKQGTKIILDVPI
ncbi:histidine kinase [Bacillus canaveralius]|uniref:histidine kinase n=1 Tax=Bacillus canaveralius TaxID=1403243 RepID=A0A2N5GSX8_9BACI|nr:PAS domain-containing protein [Bacillus canaveralius]PLR86876.1 histidine kinase [Bacillus canaveralius]PLR93364.1 histidine kinase [Bacillus canaveralius]RSK50425.1 PAS domain S-box protein [Bacillus canaveralius]